jgi:hypothetical protein
MDIFYGAKLDLFEMTDSTVYDFETTPTIPQHCFFC